ncbi:hypothetical protein [Actinocrispum sp. NPDC049592]|uniref:hypothetical protein n=1 Tax=Actinocrispum sp. NPDC049592 TaxID=3154835 RepID=UPI00342A0387
MIVPQFGAAYENPVRAWWFDPADLLCAARAAEAGGLEILGSIHMHPDWPRLGLGTARAHPLCERPTPMDEYVFHASGWPVNLVCYLERLHGRLYHSLAAWRPGDSGCVQDVSFVTVRGEKHHGRASQAVVADSAIAASTT